MHIAVRVVERPEEPQHVGPDDDHRQSSSCKQGLYGLFLQGMLRDGYIGTRLKGVGFEFQVGLELSRVFRGCRDVRHNVRSIVFVLVIAEAMNVVVVVLLLAVLSSRPS